jgi:uncharacterized membrane protein
MIRPEVLFLMVPGSLIGAFGSILMKKGAKSFTLDMRKLKNNATALAGVSLFAISSVFYVIALGIERLSVLYPLSSLTYLMVAFLSTKFLGEKMTVSKWVGVIFIVIGSFLVVK